MFLEERIASIIKELAEIKAQQAETLQLLRNSAPSPAEEDPISTDEAAKEFGIAKQTLYQNAPKIKHSKRFGRLYWYRSDIREYLRKGGVQQP